VTHKCARESPLPRKARSATRHFALRQQPSHLINFCQHAKPDASDCYRFHSLPQDRSPAKQAGARRPASEAVLHAEQKAAQGSPKAPFVAHFTDRRRCPAGVDGMGQEFVNFDAVSPNSSNLQIDGICDRNQPRNELSRRAIQRRVAGYKQSWGG
jgi:hypothetical protein